MRPAPSPPPAAPPRAAAAPPPANREKADAASAADAKAAAPAPVKEEPINAALQIDQLRLELGYGLLGLINSEKGQRLTDQIKALRRQLAVEMGFIMPSGGIQDTPQVPAHNSAL